MYRLKPAAAQVVGLQRYLDVTRDLYNAALEQRIAAYRRTGRSPGWFDQSGEIKELRAAGMLDGVHVHVAQRTLRRLDLAYAAFFRRCGRRSRRKGFPRFRGARHWRSFTFQEWGNGVQLDEPARRLRICRVGAVRLRLHRPLAGTPKTCTIVRKADGWYAHIVCEQPGVEPAVDDDPAVRAALDLGVETLARLHDGTPVENARHLRGAHSKLSSEQRALARKQKGSRRRAKQRERVARVHLKLARARRDFHHKQARKLAERYRFIAVEDLAVAAMTRSAKGTTANPGRRVRQKTGLNRSILDAAWSQFVQLLEAKLQEQGGQLVRVKPQGTSQACSRCGAQVPKPLSARRHRCPACGLSIHRDHNAAINIYNRAWAAPVAEAA